MNNQDFSILYVDDEENLRKLVAYDLKLAGFDFDVFPNGLEALQAMQDKAYDFCIIDWMMPVMSGIELVKAIRNGKHDAILMMLSAKEEEEDIVEAFEAGVDDYMRKPFSSRELVLRIQAHLKRYRNPVESEMRFGKLSVDQNQRTVTIDEHSVFLTRVEFDLLVLFLKNQDRVLSRDEILNTLWNFEYDGDTRIVDVHIFKLKTKLKEADIQFKSVRGIGYRLEQDDEKESVL